MSGPNFTGPAVFAGVGKGIQEGIDLALKYKHFQNEEARTKAMDAYYKHRFAVQGVNDFYSRGGHLKPIDDGEDAGPTSWQPKPEMDFDPELVERQSPTQNQGAMALGGE